MGEDTDMKYVNIRIGIVSNQENECRSPDSFIGLGAKHHLSPCGKLYATNSCGNLAACAPVDNGLKNIFSIGYVFAR